MPYEEGRSILASYTCTPVVHFPLADLTRGTKTVGRTVAELGAMNQPLDMVSFTQDGEEYLLVANSAHGLVKIACRDIDGQEPLTEPTEPVGVPREAKDLQGIRRLANLDGEPRAGPAGRRRGPPAPAVFEDCVAVSRGLGGGQIPARPRGEGDLVAAPRRGVHSPRWPGRGDERPGAADASFRGRPDGWCAARHGRAA